MQIAIIEFVLICHIINLLFAHCDKLKNRTGTNLQVDNGAKLAEMLIEFADVVELRWNLPNKQLGVGGELSSFMVALVV